MIKFAVKVGLASGAVYYTAEQGVWKDPETTTKLYESMKSHACPYITDLKKQLPFELPTLPKTENGSHFTKTYWNSGVKSVFVFLLDLPNTVKNWGISAYESFESFANSPPVPAVEEKKETS